MQARLVVVGGEATPPEVDVELPVSIGRGGDNGLCLPHPLVSRHHCRLVERDGVIAVEDLGSLNGTYVGKLRVESTLVLPPGGLLTVGTVTFRALYRSAWAELGESDDPEAFLGVPSRQDGSQETDASFGAVKTVVQGPTPDDQATVVVSSAGTPALMDDSTIPSADELRRTLPRQGVDANSAPASRNPLGRAIPSRGVTTQAAPATPASSPVARRPVS